MTGKSLKSATSFFYIYKAIALHVIEVLGSTVANESFELVG